MKKYFCSDKSWHEIIRASQLFKFQGLMGHVKDNLEDWHRFYDTADPLQAEWREKIRFGRIDFFYKKNQNTESLLIFMLPRCRLPGTSWTASSGSCCCAASGWTGELWLVTTPQHSPLIGWPGSRWPCGSISRAGWARASRRSRHSTCPSGAVCNMCVNVSTMCDVATETPPAPSPSSSSSARALTPCPRLRSSPSQWGSQTSSR